MRRLSGISAPVFALVLGGGSLGLSCRPVATPAPVDVSTLEWPSPSLAQVDERLAAWLRERQQELQREVLAHPDDHQRAGQIFGELGIVLDAWEERESALLAYQNAALLAPDQVRWSHLAGLVHRDAGRSAEAVEAFRRASAADPTAVASRVFIADIELDRGDLEAAERTYREVLRVDPASAAAEQGLGQIALARGEAAEAVAHLQKALELQPQATRLHYPLSQALRQTGRIDEASAELERAGRARVAVDDPHHQLISDVRAQTAVRLVGEMAGDLDTVSDVELMRFALAQLSRTNGAVEVLGGMASEPGLEPGKRARLLYAIAVLEIYAARDERAIGLLEEAIDLAPGMADAWLRLGNALVRVGRIEPAEAAFERAVELDPSGDGLLARATLRLNRGDSAGAREDLRVLRERRPRDGIVRVRLAEALEVGGDPGRALAELEQGRADLELPSGERAEVARGLGDAHRRRRNYPAAIAAYRSAVELDPTPATARIPLAQLLGHVGRFDEAAAEFARVVVDQPKNEEARRGELIALVLAERWDAARQRVDAAVAELPDSVAVADLAARVLAASPASSLRHPQQALELAFVGWNTEETARHADTVALAMAAAGRPNEAAEWQQRALRMGLGDPAAEVRLRAFQRGADWSPRDPTELLGAPG